MNTRGKQDWECLTCYSAGAVRWSENGNLYRLRQDGTRGGKVGVASIWSKWVTDRFGPQVLCQLCGTIVDPDQLSISPNTAREDVRFWLGARS